MKDKNRDLTSDTALAEAITATVAESRGAAKSWYPRLRAHLARVKEATLADLSDRAFLEKLWEDESVSSTGMGSVKVGPALEDPAFRTWFSRAFTAPLPEDDAQVEAYLINLYKDIEHHLREKCDRVARLKLNRVMCARFPKYFTTLADVGALKVLHRALGGTSSDHPVHAHMAIKRRIDNLLGAVDSSVPNGDLDRLSLPWFLYDHISNEPVLEAETTLDSTGSSPTAALRPLPAALRRKGLTAVKGYFGT